MKYEEIANLPPMITLFTDAGFCPETGVGSWAAWAKYNGETFRNSGIFKNECRNSNVAEVYAICNGFISTLDFFKPPENTLILIQSDSTTAIATFENGTVTLPDDLKKAVNHFRNKKSQYKVRCKFKHVKGHKGTVTPRNAVNTACDARCTELLKQARINKKASPVSE